MNLQLKANVGRNRRSIVVILDCFNFWWEGGEVGRWGTWEGVDVVRWNDGKCGTVVRWEGGRFLVLFKGRACKVSPRFHIFCF